MRYHQPYGINDPDAPYINGDPSIARQGSIIPAEAVEFPQREIIAAIEGAKMVSDDADLAQLLLAMRSQRMNYAVAIGGGAMPADTVAVEFDPPIGNSMTPGMPLRIKAAANNTGPALLMIDNISHALRHADGSELIADEIKNGVIFGAVWNDAGYWEFNSYMGIPGGGGGGTGDTINNTYSVNIPYIADTGTTNALIANFVPPITSLVGGTTVEVKLANDITGPSTIKVNALAPVPVIRANGQPLQAGDAVIGQIMLLIYSATASAFQFSGLIPKPAANLGPCGSIILTPGNTAFPGTLKLNGAMLVRSEHPLLWTFANSSGRLVNESEWQTPASRFWTAFSRGDGSTTFRLPDFRAEFLRFWDDGRGADSGRLLTTQQKDAVGEFSITANMTIHNLIANPESGNIPGPGIPVMWLNITATSTQGGGDNPLWGVQADHVTSLSGSATINGNTGLETRTRNTVVTACIVDG